MYKKSKLHSNFHLLKGNLLDIEQVKQSKQSCNDWNYLENDKSNAYIEKLNQVNALLLHTYKVKKVVNTSVPSNPTNVATTKLITHGNMLI